MINPTRVTILLGLVVLALGGYILFIDIPKTREFKKQETQERQLLPFDDRAITDVTWVSRTESIRLTRDERYRWEIVEPIRTHGDAREVRRMLRALTIGKIKRTIEDGQSDLKKYGLAPPYLTLTLKTPTESHEIALGEPGPFAPSLYVQTKADNQVVLTTLDVMTFAKRSLANFRLKDILLFDRERAIHLSIQHDQAIIELSRVAGAHSLTPNWKLTKPIVGAADKTVVGTLLMDLSDLTATGFVDDEEAHHKILQQTPHKKATVHITVGNKKHQAQLYQFSDREKAYAKTSEKGPLYEITPAILGPLTQPIFYYQNKRLFGMEPHEVAMLEVRTLSDRYLLIKQHDQWVLNSEPEKALNQELVKLFISRVVDLPAEINFSDPATIPTDHGLDLPKISIRGMDKNGKERGRLDLGARKTGLVYVKGNSLSGIYLARSTILNQIPSKTDLLQ